MYIQRNPDGSLPRVHPFIPTFVVVCRNGRRVYHVVESAIRQFMAENAGNIAGFYLVRGGRTITLPF